MNRPDVHPDTELLDRLHAGLLDGDPRRPTLQAHLDGCAECRRRANWQELVQNAPLATAADTGRLDQARRQALHMRSRSAISRRWLPLAAAASLALLAVLLVSPWQQSGNPEPQLAANGKDTPELYEELDFYLWLADHKRVDQDSATRDI